MSIVPRPPAHLQPYYEVLGLDLTIEFLLQFGGAELYIPASSKGRSELVALIGDDKTRELAARAERLPARVPIGKPWLADVFRCQGSSVAQIARRLHVSDVAVRRWHRDADAERMRQRQRSLF